MEKIAYLDCPTGIAGSMCLGALVDAGMPLGELNAGLQPLGLEGEYTLVARQVNHRGQRATEVSVELNEQATLGHRHLPEIEALITDAALPPQVEQQSLAIFRQLATAEAAVHGIPKEQVHFHEVGATDAIVDVVGTCLGLAWLGVERLICSPLPTGGGTVRAAHGLLPVPAPAVLHLLAQGRVPVYGNGIQKELVTPTGAAITTTLCQRFGPPPAMILETVGLGAGRRSLPLPNMLRLWLGQAAAEEPTGAEHHTHPEQPGYSESVVELQTQLDDLSPQAVGYLYSQLFSAGALDVFTQTALMKKNRPGMLLTVLCLPERLNDCTQTLFAETTTLGIRTSLQQRQALYRTYHTVNTPYGDVSIKAGLASPQGPVLNLQPEYEDCARLARARAVPWKQVQQSAIAAAQDLYCTLETVTPEGRT